MASVAGMAGTAGTASSHDSAFDAAFDRQVNALFIDPPASYERMARLESTYARQLARLEEARAPLKARHQEIEEKIGSAKEEDTTAIGAKALKLELEKQIFCLEELSDMWQGKAHYAKQTLASLASMPPEIITYWAEQKEKRIVSSPFFSALQESFITDYSSHETFVHQAKRYEHDLSLYLVDWTRCERNHDLGVLAYLMYWQLDEVVIEKGKCLRWLLENYGNSKEAMYVLKERVICQMALIDLFAPAMTETEVADGSADKRSFPRQCCTTEWDGKI